MLENACFRLENSCEHFVMVPNRRKHDIFYALYERQTQESLRFLAFTHIKLPGKCVFSAANFGEYVVVYGENANEQKENKLFEVS